MKGDEFSVGVPRGDASKAVAYLRTSTKRQRQGIERQREKILAWASWNTVNVVAWHEEQKSGALGIDSRPALAAAIESLKQHGAGALVVEGRDRLARSMVVAAIIEEAVASCGARIVSLDVGDGAYVEFERNIMNSVARYERERGTRESAGTNSRSLGA